jgi:gamma-glutamyl hydrolase
VGDVSLIDPISNKTQPKFFVVQVGRMRNSAVALCLLLPLAAVAGIVTDRPVIGILSLPWDTSLASPSLANQLNGVTAYIPASYVKFVEAGGARVVPLHHRLPLDQLESIVSKLNGVLFTGGQDINDLNDPYYASAKKIIDIAMNDTNRLEDRSQGLVLWGTCLGMETISRIASQNYSILSHFQAMNVSLTNKFKSDVQDSTMFSKSYEQSAWAVKQMSEKNISFNAHNWGLSPADFEASSLLSKHFKVLATSLDLQGSEFIAAIEAKNYPVFAVQFHPEKTLFEWGAFAIDHSSEAVESMQYFSDFLSDQARLSGSRKFDSEQELQQYLIYNYSPVATNGYFTQMYFFPDPPAQSIM